MTFIINDVRNNCASIHRKMEIACEKAGRNMSEVQLMAVSKTQEVGRIKLAFEAGLRLFGENRVQEIRDKGPFFNLYKSNCHMIGKLQKNKVKYLPPFTNFIQSVDSVSLAKEIEKQYAKHDKTVDILIQVNIGDECTKSGVKPSEVFDVADEICGTFEHVRLKGLMCIPPPIVGDGEELRRNFATMRACYEKLQNKSPNGADISVLSMGMSDDFETAIEEGSTLVRVGSALFGVRKY